MSKITFRADEDLVERVEGMEASKSEVMREALRSYLERDVDAADGSLDDLVVERIDALVGERVDAASGSDDVNVNITIESDAGAVRATADRESASDPAPEQTHAPSRGLDRTSDSDRTCRQCGETLASDHVYCPNCGEKAVRRIFCECGDELRSDWAYCPACGRRTPSADVLER
ncbi:zinc ribbon domain-containing protein [Halobacteriaceae archaeon GCM10025711]